MKSSVIRTVSAVALAGSLAVGASACTTVTKSEDGGSSAAPASAPSTSSDSSSSSSDSSSSESSSSDSSPASSASSESSESSSSDSGSDASGLKTGKVGQEVSTSYYKAKVNKITDNVQADNDYETPKAGTRFVSVNVMVTNTGKDKLSMSDGYLEAHLNDDTDVKGSYKQIGDSSIGFKELYAGDKVSGDIVFEVPQGKKITSLTFKPISIERSGDEEAVRITVE